MEEDVHLSKSEEKRDLKLDAGMLGVRLEYMVIRNYLIWRNMLRALELWFCNLLNKIEIKRTEQ